MSETIEEALIKHMERISELEKRSYKLLDALVQIADADVKGSAALKFADWAQMLAAEAVAEFEQNTPTANYKKK